MEIKRALQLPSPDRPFWRAPPDSSAALLYLAWGSRQFGTSPVYPETHEGWVYVMLDAGAPMLQSADRFERIVTPALLIIGPDFPFGWNDEPKKTSRFLLWMWKEPRYSVLRGMARNGITKLPLAPGELSLLRQIHADCRKETQTMDPHSPAALEGLQLTLEAYLVRTLRRGERDSPDQSLARALHWLELHPDSRQPLTRLADYLGQSPSSVQRLFRKQNGKSVMQVVTQIRLRIATTMLKQQGASVKETAYSLGYRHANDFSRAYRRGTGATPTTHP